MSDSPVIEKNHPPTIRAWVMYDWANSVFQLTIASAIFPVYFASVTMREGSDRISFFGLEIINTVLYSWTIAAAYLLVAVLSPGLGAVADYTGRRKAFMKGFTWTGAVGCGMLFFFGDIPIEAGMAAFFLAWLGYGGSLVFYNSFLPVIADSRHHDHISARGYSMGYLGGVTLLIINLLFILFPAFFFIRSPALPYQLSFLTVFIWWTGFAQITFRHLPKYTFGNPHRRHVILNGYMELLKVWRQIRQSRSMLLYLSAFFFLSSGTLTVMFMAATYGEKELRLEAPVLIGTILCIQLLGVAGAFLFAKLSARFGNIRMLMAGSLLWVIVCTWAYHIRGPAGFIAVAACVGLVMGGTQALARSTWAKMLPETRDHTSYFSFYDVMEKLSTVAGLFSFGIMETLTGNMRKSVLSVVAFFTAAMLILVMLQAGTGSQKPVAPDQ